MEKEYSKLLGVDFEITVNAPTTHALIHPSLMLTILNEVGRMAPLEILIHKKEEYNGTTQRV